MKKTILILATFGLVLACQQEEGLEAKRAQLKEKQSDMADLKKEISELEQEIAEMDTTIVEKEVLVETKAIKPETFEHFVKLTGTVTSKENIMISAETAGKVVAIPASEGQKVSLGTVLVRIDNDGVASQLQEAKAAYELAEVTYKKRKALWDQNIGSEIEFLQAKNNYETTKSRLAQVQTQYDNTIIKAPIHGTVDDIVVKTGEFVSMGSPIVRVVDLERVEIEAELSEEYLTTVHKGDSVKVTISALGLVQMAPVSFVSQVINENNRSFKIKINLSNKDGRIKPNVLADLMIRDYKNQDALVVPSNSIVKDLKGDYVYVNSNGVARKTYIEKGQSFGAKTEVVKGLNTGDEVIVAGFNQVNDGEKIALK